MHRLLLGQQKNIRRICRRNYPSLASSVATSQQTIDSALLAMVSEIRKEIKHICSKKA